jgi:predicted RNase H-like HicB family nuclease
MEQGKVAGYKLRLDAWFRRDERAWLAWCPAIKVITQAESKKAAGSALVEAVELWFESCIERGVLNQALEELGFSRVDGEISGEHAQFVQVFRQNVAKKPAMPSFHIAGKRGSDYIEGMIPAYIAAQQSGNAGRASA